MLIKENPLKFCNPLNILNNKPSHKIPLHTNFDINFVIKSFNLILTEKK